MPESVRVYLDNGAFYLWSSKGDTSHSAYGDFASAANPDWKPVPRDYIPTPAMSIEEQRECLKQTMEVNLQYRQDGYVPVIHASQVMKEYVAAVLGDEHLAQKPAVALGGLVPNLLRAPKARPYQEILDGLRHARVSFSEKKLHLFGVGGTATLHMAALLGMDSADSSGWRNRAARGIVQLPGRGDRVVAELGNWRGRRPDDQEWEQLDACECPACHLSGLDGLKAKGIEGFCNRATHNLWTLLDEARQIDEHLAHGTYESWYGGHVENSIYKPLVDQIVHADRATGPA